MDFDKASIEKHFPNSCIRSDSKPNLMPSPLEIRTQLEAELNEQVHKILNQQFPRFSFPSKAYNKPFASCSTLEHGHKKLLGQPICKQVAEPHQLDVVEDIIHNELRSEVRAASSSKRDKVLPSTTYEFRKLKAHRQASSAFIINLRRYQDDPNRLHTKFKTREYYSEIMDLVDDDFGSMSSVQKRSYCYIHTVNGFTESLTTGKLPDGTTLQEVEPGRYLDRFGFVRWLNGPFWPLDYGPLHPAPELQMKTSNNLLEPILDGDLTIEVLRLNNPTIFSGLWKDPKIVYDSYKSAKNHRAVFLGPDFCPSLEFESRFESGNLLMARQVGQTEYELVLRNDLHTSGHTQWFYFRVKNMIKGLRYCFKIVNLSKKKCLYHQGMQPLLYSEHLATSKEIYWHRCGQQVRYFVTDQKSCVPPMDKHQTYYSLQWSMEFPQDNDTCYLAHCYPYTYSDLQRDLKHLRMKNVRSFTMEDLCMTRAGNTCFLITVDDPDLDYVDKRVVIFSARIHPGETNSSFIMRGLLEFITGSSDFAKELRKNFIFKLIPMLNPDGVIVGNYRCSLVGRDLNRNFTNPSKFSFPTVYHLKELINVYQNKIVLYCDLHGHNQKQNVFMYGCPPSTCLDDFEPEDYLRSRMIPWLMSKQSPDKFDFSGCTFHVSKGKESTARVVMFRQFHIINSFTLEATFCGTTFLKQQFNMKDFEDVGRSLCKVVDQLHRLSCDKELERTLIGDLANELNRKFSKSIKPIHLDKIKKLPSPHNESQEDAPIRDDKTQVVDLRSIIQEVFKEDSTRALEQETDSDTESEPEINTDDVDKIHKIKKYKRPKTSYLHSPHKRKIERKLSTDIPLAKPERLPQLGTKALSKLLPSKLSSNLHKITKHNDLLQTSWHTHSKSDDPPSQNQKFTTGFANKYKDRSNGGIPCFIQERLQERAEKKKHPEAAKAEATD